MSRPATAKQVDLIVRLIAEKPADERAILPGREVVETWTVEQASASIELLTGTGRYWQVGARARIAARNAR